MHCVENLRPVETNIVLFDVKESHVTDFKKILEDKNIQASFMSDSTVRFVTHLDFSDDQLDLLYLTLKNLS